MIFRRSTYEARVGEICVRHNIQMVLKNYFKTLPRSRNPDVLKLRRCTLAKVCSNGLLEKANKCLDEIWSLK